MARCQVSKAALMSGPSLPRDQAITCFALSPGTGPGGSGECGSDPFMPVRLALGTDRATAITAGSVATASGQPPVAALPQQAAWYSAQIRPAASCSVVPVRVAASASAAGSAQQVTAQLKLSGSGFRPSGFPRHACAVTIKGCARPVVMQPRTSPAL